MFGIWGYGKIGWFVVGYGKVFGMNVLVWGCEYLFEVVCVDGYMVVDSWEVLFEQSDVLLLYLCLYDDMCGIVKQEDLMWMKLMLLFVNMSCVELFEENVFVNVLLYNCLGMVVIDVFESELILQGYSLLWMENVICMLYIGYVECESYELYFSVVFCNIFVFDDGDMLSVVNLEVLMLICKC